MSEQIRKEIEDYEEERASLQANYDDGNINLLFFSNANKSLAIKWNSALTKLHAMERKEFEDWKLGK